MEKELHLRKQAMQLVTQLPDKYGDAKRVLELMSEYAAVTWGAESDLQRPLPPRLTLVSFGERSSASDLDNQVGSISSRPK